MSTLKKIFSIICICVLCLTAQAQVVIGVTRTGQVGTAGQNLEFVDQFGRIVAYPSLSPTGELLDAMRPSVVTNVTVTGVTKTSATTGGKVVAPGASDVTECGVCYGTSPYPTIMDAHLTATPDANGEYTVNLTGLQPNTTYYVRAYATNAIGTSYGTSMPFTTRGDATITITGNTESKTYNGSAQSVTGYTVTIPDGINITADQITYSGNAAATGTNVGTYTLTLSADDFSCTNANYDVNFTVTNGSLTITRADATVAITGNSDSKTYNGTEQSVTGYTVGIPSGVNIQQSEISCSVAATAKGTDVGTYNMGLTADAFSTTNGNYDVTFNVTDGALTITKATATVAITGNSGSKTYNGTEQSVTGYTVSIPSGVNIQQSEISCSATATAKGTDVGTYNMGLTADAFSTTNGNYDVTFNVTDGTLTITKAQATVTANDASKVYGATDPTFTATVTGVQSGDQLNYTLARVTGENAGTYAINVTLGDNPNYEVTTTAGTFTITKATATVTANNATKVYGATDPTFTATVTGVQSGDQLNYTLARATGENAGTYAINVAPGTNTNYEITPVAGTFTITKATATVTITGSTGSKTYNGIEQSVTGYAVSIPSGVSISTDQISYSGTAEAKGTNAGTYPMDLTQGTFTCSNPNYNVTFNVTDGSLAIARATATVTADDKTKVAGETDPQFTATVTGLQGNDQPTLLNYSCSRETGETVGTYAIKPTGDTVQGNYNVSYVNGTLTITVPPCPTLGTTTYTPDPVTSSTTTITLSTPVNNMVDDVVTISDASFTIVADGVSNRTIDATYNNNGAITASLTGLDAYRGKPIKVTPKIVVAGCSTSGAITGNTVEICVPYATRPSITAVSHTPSNPMGKTDLFNYEGVTLSATVSNYTASQVESRGFLISTNQNDIQSYSEEFAVAGGTVSSNTFKTSSKLGLSYCGKKWYYRAFIKLKGCEEPVLSSINNFQMWGPESATNSNVAGPTVSASPSSVTAGQTVTLTATAYMTVGTGNLGTHPLEEWMHYSDQSWYPGDLSSLYQMLMPSILSSYGITEQAWTYRWEDENGQTIYSNHTSGTTTVTPTQTTTYTAYGEFLYNGETCRVSKSIKVTVQ